MKTRSAAMPGMEGRRGGLRGFTLLEVLVALVVLAVTLAAAMRAAGVATQAGEELRMRLLAEIVASNQLELMRSRSGWPAVGVAEGSETQGGQPWRWRQEVSATPNPEFRRVDVFVYAGASDHVLARLAGFATAPGTR